MYPDYPLSVWFLGLILLLKAVFWMFANPLLVHPAFGVKCLVVTGPYLVCWQAVWNRKPWAVKATLLLAGIDLVLSLVLGPAQILIPFDIPVFSVMGTQGIGGILFRFLNLLILICSGFIGYAANILILITGAVALRADTTTPPA